MILTKGTVGLNARPLTEAKERTRCRVCAVRGPEKLRLSEMGLVEGAEVTVLNRVSADSLLIRVHGGCLALSRGLDSQIWVI